MAQLFITVVNVKILGLNFCFKDSVITSKRCAEVISACFDFKTCEMSSKQVELHQECEIGPETRRNNDKKLQRDPVDGRRSQSQLVLSSL